MQIISVLFVLFHLSFSNAAAQTKAEADSAYTQGRYQQAIVLYQKLIDKGQSVELYYNLGNAYYRQDDITHAILNYERALMLAPGDADIRFNLQMAQSKTIDKIVPESEMFFFTWYRSVVNLCSADGWATYAILTLAMAILLALIYLFASPVWLRKVGFFSAVLMLLVFVLANIFAWQQQRELLNRQGAIIMEGAVPVKSTPTTDGTDLFILHEGTKVRITDDSMKEWKEIQVPDGKEGWVKTKQLERI